MAKKTPTPRKGSYYGMAIHNTVAVNGTWLEGEEFAYPHGRETRRCYAEHEGTRRVVLCGIPDTYFSIPAKVRIKGKVVRGYVTGEENGFRFVPSGLRR
jgi:hypothetical protein